MSQHPSRLSPLWTWNPRNDVYFESSISFVHHISRARPCEQVPFWDYQQCVFFGGGGAIKEAHYLKKTMSSLTPQLINTSSYEHTHNIHYMKGRASKQSNFWISEFYHLEAVSLSNTLVVGTVFRTYWTFVLSQTNTRTWEAHHHHSEVKEPIILCLPNDLSWDMPLMTPRVISLTMS